MRARTPVHRPNARLWLTSFWAVGVLLLASCAAPFGLRSSENQAVIVGQDKLVAREWPLAGVPALAEARALTIAEHYVATRQQASGITTRYVALTLQADDGTIAWGIDKRPVWLVQFVGARYAPVAYPESDCACDGLFQPPNTDVAVDARTGSLVIDYGTSTAVFR